MQIERLRRIGESHARRVNMNVGHAAPDDHRRLHFQHTARSKEITRLRQHLRTPFEHRARCRWAPDHERDANACPTCTLLPGWCSVSHDAAPCGSKRITVEPILNR